MVDKMGANRHYSLVTEKVKNYLKENRIDFKQNQVNSNIFKVPTGFLQVAGTMEDPIYFINGEEVDFYCIKDAVTVKEFTSLSNEETPF
jgi:hypothetical protein